MAFALALLAKSALGAVLAPFIDEARDAALNAVQGAVRSKLAGRIPIEEWAEAVIESADNIKNRAAEEENLRYVGGNLKFTLSENAPNAVTVSFQLYFQDELGKWRKAEAASDVPANKFTEDALEIMKENGEIVYEVE